MNTAQLIEPETLALRGQESESPKDMIRLPLTVNIATPPTSSPDGTRASLDQFNTNATDFFADVLPPDLSEIHLRHSRLLPNRFEILSFMPKGGVCAEVGTQTGEFAKHILSVLQPRLLHIFDLDYSLFDHAHFHLPIQQGRVQLHQGDSSSRLGALPDRSFDFIYIDGDHSYAGVKRDLAQAARKIKDGGWIVCNDYTIYSPLEKCKYGVYRAVNEFCLRNNYEILYFGLHAWGYHDVALRMIATPATPADEDESLAAVAGDIEDNTTEFILKRLAQAGKGHPFADFVANLLNTMGYRTRVSLEGPDGGIDIVAHKDELGLEPPIIKVQVKNTEVSIGDPVVSALYGKVCTGEFGLLVTLGSFSTQAVTFAKSKSNLRLIDGEELVKLIFQHYDQLDPRYKGLLPLRRVYVPEIIETDRERT
jgi:ubiquinone/menaquinone biosynthesis C-methylase UbiE